MARMRELSDTSITRQRLKITFFLFVFYENKLG